MPDTGFGPALFQKFATRTTPDTVVGRLKALRARIAEAGLDGFLVPRADAHRGESVPDSEARLAFVTSFTGSAGTAVVGPKKAGLFVDSRYTLQAPIETDTRLVTVVETPNPGADARIADFVPRGRQARLRSVAAHTGRDQGSEREAGGQGDAGAVASISSTRFGPTALSPPVTPVEFLGHNRAGRTAKEKLAELRKTLAAENADAVVLTLPDSINWLFNMRGRDVPNFPGGPAASPSCRRRARRRSSSTRRRSARS